MFRNNLNSLPIFRTHIYPDDEAGHSQMFPNIHCTISDKPADRETDTHTHR